MLSIIAWSAAAFVIGGIVGGLVGMYVGWTSGRFFELNRLANYATANVLKGRESGNTTTFPKGVK